MKHREPSKNPSSEVEPAGRGEALHPIFSAAAYLGPIPPATEAENWNRIVSGAAERILRMAEMEAAHRQTLELEQQQHMLQLQRTDLEGRRRELELSHQFHSQVLVFEAQCAERRNERIKMGQIFGLILGAGALLVAAYLGVLGQPWVAALMGTGGLAGIVWAASSGERRHRNHTRPPEPATQPKGDRRTG